MKERIKVLIVDDHRLMREGLVALLDDETDIDVVGSVGTVAEALEQVDAGHPDVVLMDYRLPDQDGAAATQSIRASHPDVAVVFLSADGGQEALFAAVEAGAAGFVTKAEAATEVADAVRRAALGDILVPQSVLARLIQHQRRRAVDQRQREHLLTAMTAREMEVLGLMADGLGNQQIAEHLSISYLTVRGHVRNVLAKLDSHSKLAAVARAVEYGLIAPRHP